MKLKLVLLASIAVALPVSAFAQTCSSPLPLYAGSSYNADTTSASNTVGQIGPLPSPGNDVVYSFVASGMNASEAITITVPDYNWGVALTKACAATIGISDFLQGTGNSAGTGGSLPLNDGGAALSDGVTYYVIVTNSPADNTGPSGTLTMTTPTPLPVKLQKFSVQ